MIVQHLAYNVSILFIGFRISVPAAPPNSALQQPHEVVDYGAAFHFQFIIPPITKSNFNFFI